MIRDYPGKPNFPKRHLDANADIYKGVTGLRKTSREMSLSHCQQRYLPLGRCVAAVVSVLLFSAVALWSQAPAPESKREEACGQVGSPSTQPAQAESGKEAAEKKLSAAPDDSCTSKSRDESEGKQTNRIMGVVPNFAAVSANTQLPPLSTKGKFWLATEDSFDYSSFIWTGILAGQGFGLKSYPEFGQGMAGYGRYYWHTFVDGVSGTFFTEAIVPWISREDPRYYTLGHGGFFRRSGYALSRVVITKTDSGGRSFNWSEVGGNALEATLANAYYPSQERGARQTAINWGAQIESAVLNNIAKEFWPDIRRLIFREK
jgi:hypothetical protein